MTRKDIKRGLLNNEFVMHYQPIIDLTTMEISGHEALIRWQHPTKGLLYPDGFIEEAEKDADTIFDVFQFSLYSAMSSDLQGFKAINLSATSLMHDGFLELIHEVKDKDIELEITERVSLEDASIERLAKIKAIGELSICLAVDDFTGASLNHLAKILGAYQHPELLKVKLDIPLIQSLDQPFMPEIIKAIIYAAHILGIQVVCEGVEQINQHQFLISAGCDFGQGYFYGKPRAIAYIFKIIHMI